MRQPSQVIAPTRTGHRLWGALAALCIGCAGGTDAATSGSDPAAGEADSASTESQQPAAEGTTEASATTTTAQSTLQNGWIELSVGGRTVRAIYQHPGSASSVPAVIYNHGKKVEINGYDGAAQAGYDVQDFVEAFAKEGFAAIAPIRAEGSSASDGIFSAALKLLRSQPNIDPTLVFMTGFSRGGLLTLEFAVADDSELRGIVLLAPAPGKGNTQLQTAIGRVSAISIPVFVARGKDEPNPAIVQDVDTLISKLKELGKTVEHKTDYPGDHEWFYQVRSEYWNDVVAFMKSHAGR